MNVRANWQKKAVVYLGLAAFAGVGIGVACWMGSRGLEHEKASARVQDGPLENAPLAAVPAAPRETLLFTPPTSTRGERLDLTGPAYRQARATGARIAGRSATVDPESFAVLEQLAEGERVRIPLPGGESLRGVVQVTELDEAGWRRVGGTLQHSAGGTFSFSWKEHEASGLVQLPAQRLAYQIERQSTGATALVERPLNNLVCLDLPLPLAAAAPTFKPMRRAAAAEVETPILNSRANAPAVVLLDFDGERVRDPAWNGGGQIDAEPSGYSVTQIRDIWRRVKEDYVPFNINITTDPARYRAAPVGTRMRCIITPTNFLPQPTGGIAYVGSFARRDGAFRPDIPCWVFVVGIPFVCADAVAHEVGHTFGLHHDGCNSSSGFEEYYGGQGSGPTSWGPIMGAPYGVALSQWSRGTYPGANNSEDDIGIISGAANGFYYAPDQVGDTPQKSTPLVVENTVFSQSGNIERFKDADVFSFRAAEKSALIVSARGLGAGVGNLDLRLDLLDAAGTQIAVSAENKVLGGTVNYALSPGTYYLRVRGWGEGELAGYGYTRYGSRGHYTLSGRITPSH